MSTERIASRLMGFDNTRDERNLRILLTAAQTDSAALRAALVALTAKLDVLAAKLNADAGVSDSDYPVNFASSLNPPTLRFIQ